MLFQIIARRWYRNFVMTGITTTLLLVVIISHYETNSIWILGYHPVRPNTNLQACISYQPQVVTGNGKRWTRRQAFSSQPSSYPSQNLADTFAK